MSKPTYIGIDLETTGKDTKLDPNENVILEVAVVVLDDELNPLEVWTSTIYPEKSPVGCKGPSIRKLCSDHVFDMHRSTGLIDDDGVVQDNPIPLAEAEISIMKIVSKRFRTAAMVDRPTLLGHSIQFERRFLEVHMPHLSALLHYRQLDARSIELLAPELEWGKADTKHRALSDIMHSIAVLRKGRERLLASECVKSITPMIKQRVADIVDLYNEEGVSDRVREIVLNVDEGNYAAAQAMAEHAEELEEGQPQLVYYLQGLRDAGAYPLERARLLLEGARTQCESIRKQWLKDKAENDFLRKHLREAQEEIDALRIQQGKT